MHVVVATAAVSAPRIVDALAEPANAQLTVLALVRGSDAMVQRDRQSFFELWWSHSLGSGARAPADMPSFFEIGQLRSRGWHPECERQVPGDASLVALHVTCLATVRHLHVGACRECGSPFPDVNPGI